VLRVSDIAGSAGLYRIDAHRRSQQYGICSNLLDSDKDILSKTRKMLVGEILPLVMVVPVSRLLKV
jgi:hypothetical protein